MQLESLLEKLGFENITPTNNGWVNFSCPLGPYRAEHNFSKDSNPSAGAIISDNNQVHWNCFCCKSGGNIINLLRYLNKKEKRDLEDIISELENSVYYDSYDDFYLTKTSKIKEIDKPIEDFIYNKLYGKLSLDAAKYLYNRGISGKTARKIGLVFDGRNQRIIFPFIRNNKIYGTAGRTIVDEKPKVKHSVFDTQNYLLGEHLWTGKPTVLVEGLFAYAKLHEFNFDEQFDIAAISGTKISDYHKSVLLKKDLPVYLFLDGDEAGLSGTIKAVEKLSDDLIVFSVKYGDKKDIDVLTKDEIQVMLDEASQEALTINSAPGGHRKNYNVKKL